MRSKIVSQMDSSSYEYAFSYVQINIYNTNIKALERRGVDLKHILQHFGCHSVIMDVPVPKTNSPVFFERIKMNQADSADCQIQRSNSSFPDLFAAKECNDNLKSHGLANEVEDTPVVFHHNDAMHDQRHQIRPETSPPSRTNDEIAECEGKAVCYDDERQYQMDQIADNEIQMEQNGGSAESVMNETMMVDESDEDGRSNAVNGDTPDESRIIPNISFTNESIANLDNSDSAELSKALSLSSIRSFDENCSCPPHTFRQSSERQNFVLDNPEVFSVAKPAVNVESGVVEDHVQKSFLHPDEVYEDSVVDGDAEKISPEHEEVEVKASSSKFLPDLESGSKIGATVEEEHGHTVSDPASSSVQEVFVNHAETTGDKDKCVVARKQHFWSQYIVKQRMSSAPKCYQCKVEGCNQQIRLRYGYGKQRLVEHVRTHWRKPVKKCKLCTFRASHVYKVYYHHRHKHKGSEFCQPESLETNEDRNELVQMWKQCFDVPPPRFLLRGLRRL
ncbi:hypothetical protein KIN20_031837 [Parelaphostrongylus tenuis]|uniref:Uncharacterized protein n=1 Tax=Parelaphostrongylus tenuis TaxID=148309 RepID=A0AAD5R5N8_PARTN|nr:hypothetical protein KIN20_031837 [Parelaphostrongylus tenuis]